MLSDSAQIGVCVGLAALLQTGSSAVGFQGYFRDDSKLQSDLMRKKHLDEAQAAERVAKRRRGQRAVLALAWFTSLFFSVLAVIVILAS